MTKRFIIDDAGTLIDMQTRDTFDYVSDVVNLFNELVEENEQLRTKSNAYIQDIETYKEENTHLKLENEQLKDKYNEQSVEYEGLEEQVERLLDFKDKVFNLINKKLKETDKGFEQTYDSWYQGQVDVLKELKKELQE